jgi:hypothetical protein
MNLLDIFTENEKIGGMPADKFDAAMARLKQRASQGPLKTVWDPVKRVYKNVPVNPPKPGMTENAEGLNVGDDVIITGNVEFQGKTGVIDSFGQDNRFVVVNLYNHGRHSFHSSDVSVNDYADSDEEEARMYDSGAFDRSGVAEGKKKKKKKSSQSLRGYFFPGYAYYGAGDSGEGGGESKNHGMEEAKGLKKRVRIVKGSEAGKTGTIGEVRHGAYKGAPKTFTVDIDGGGSIQLPKEALRLLKDQGVAEGSLNELSKNTLKSYSRERGTTIHQDQRDADRARDTAADKKKHGNTKAAADWNDEASWLDKRAEKGAKGVAQAAIKIAKKGMAEGFNAEYDDEAGMAHTNLHTIARSAQGLLDTINDEENLPEWVQEKIVKAQAMLVAAWDYLKSQEEQGIDPRMGMNEMSGVGGVNSYREIQTFKNPPSRDPQDRLPSHIKILIQQLKRDPKYTPEQRLELIQNLVSQHTIDRKIGEDISVDGRALEAGAIVYNGAIGVGEVLGSDGRTVRVRSWEGRENRLAPSTVRFVANRETQPTLYTWKGRPQVGVLDRLNQRFQERDQDRAQQHLAELSFLGSECTKDCSGHRAGYDWSHSKGLRQANSPYSPSFNKGAALAVAGK